MNKKQAVKPALLLSDSSHVQAMAKSYNLVILVLFYCCCVVVVQLFSKLHLNFLAMATKKAANKAQQPTKSRATVKIPAAGKFNNNRRLVAVPATKKTDE